MRLRTIGKVIYFYVILVLVMALAHSIYDSASTRDEVRGFWGLGAQHSLFLYPAIWAGDFAEKFTTLEQVGGFAAIFVGLGMVAIIGKVTERKKSREAGNLAPVIDANRPATLTDKILSILCHLAAWLGIGFFLPLIVYGLMKDTSEFVANNAKEALMFQFSLFIYFVGVLVLAAVASALVGPLVFALGIGYLGLSIIATFKAARGLCYRYPLTLWFLRKLEVGRII